MACMVPLPRQPCGQLPVDFCLSLVDRLPRALAPLRHDARSRAPQVKQELCIAPRACLGGNCPELDRLHQRLSFVAEHAHPDSILDPPPTPLGQPCRVHVLPLSAPVTTAPIPTPPRI